MLEMMTNRRVNVYPTNPECKENIMFLDLEFYQSRGKIYEIAICDNSGGRRTAGPITDSLTISIVAEEENAELHDISETASKFTDCSSLCCRYKAHSRPGDRRR